MAGRRELKDNGRALASLRIVGSPHARQETTDNPGFRPIIHLGGSVQFRKRIQEAGMSGAGGSDDDMVVGEKNWADGTTTLWAKVPPGSINFYGWAILTVHVAEDYSPDDGKDDYEDATTFVPDNLFHGIVSTGFSGQVFGSDSPDAVGVIGRGGRKQGTGVRGLGGGAPGVAGGVPDPIQVIPAPAASESMALAVLSRNRTPFSLVRPSQAPG